jgi:hypothetical protein
MTTALPLTFEQWVDRFPWQSEVQKKGFLAMYQWFLSLPKELRTDDTRYACVASWFAQKDHESNEWWVKTVGDQVSGLQDQIRLLQQQMLELKSELAEMKKAPQT